MLSWPYLVPEDKKFRIEAQEAPKFDEKNSRLLGLRYIGVDNHNQCYSITSSKAEQTDEKNSTITLTNPVSDLKMNDNRWFYLASNRGILYNNQKKMELRDQVSLYNSEGFELHSDYFAIDLRTKDMESNLPVRGQGPALSLEAEGVKVSDRGNLIQLLGKSKVTLRNTAQESTTKTPSMKSAGHAP